LAKPLTRPRELNYCQSLHRLKDLCKQKKYLGQYAESITNNLQQILEKTKHAVQIGRDDFRLDRPASEFISDKQEERLWEQQLFLQWGKKKRSPIQGAWERLIAFQVPLFDQQKKDGWGYIDLVGVTPNGIPAIVELKKNPKSSPEGITKASETPLRMVLEATAYAVAIRENWSNIKPQFEKRLKLLKIDKTIPDSLVKAKIPVVAAAPAAFWIDWFPVTDKGESVKIKEWKAFQILLDQLSKHHYPVKFLSISGSYLAPDSLAIQPLQFPLIPSTSP